MTDLPVIAVAGAAGRMGQMLIHVIRDSGQARLGGLLVRPGHDWAGRDPGDAMGGSALGVMASDDPARALAGADAVIDFTSPDSSLEFAALAAERGFVHVIGTTGFSESQLTGLRAHAQRAVMIRAGNMSLGVNLLAGLVQRVAAALGEDFDIEVIEAHHNRKVDAPSGTALMLGEAAAKGRGVPLAEVSERARDGHTGARRRGDIGFAVVRGGDIVGEHDVMFAGEGERLVLSHVATDRAIFARGALRAALWGLGRPPGEYDMTDVLGL